MAPVPSILRKRHLTRVGLSYIPWLLATGGKEKEKQQKHKRQNTRLLPLHTLALVSSSSVISPMYVALVCPAKQITARYQCELERENKTKASLSEISSKHSMQIGLHQRRTLQKFLRYYSKPQTTRNWQNVLFVNWHKNEVFIKYVHTFGPCFHLGVHSFREAKEKYKKKWYSKSKMRI